MHIFLTGERQVGKTTALRGFFDAAGVSADGFVTFWQPQKDGTRRLYLDTFNNSDNHPYLLAIDRGSGAEPVDDITHVFDTYGCRILQNAYKSDFIVMDELGVLESGAAAFQSTVIQCIDGTVPVLGVLSIRHSPFLDSIRSHPKVKLIEVTMQNRPEVTGWLIRENWSYP